MEACARAGTHYADLTGEVLFVRDAIDRCDGLARDSGARIVHSCGYDSVPSDLGTLLLHEHAGEDLADVRMVATGRGGFSGATIDSLRGQLDAIRADRSLRRVVGDPHALSPDRAAEPTPDQPADAGLYGRGLRYGEVMGAGKGVAGAAAAGAITAGLATFVGAMSLRPTRALLDRVLPDPGAGPDERTRAKGRFRSEFSAVKGTGRRLRTVVAGPGDPGYAATAVMLGQSALCLACDALPDRAGSLTPATAMGSALVTACARRVTATRPGTAWPVGVVAPWPFGGRARAAALW